jgi:hypothetical protein
MKISLQLFDIFIYMYCFKNKTKLLEVVILERSEKNNNLLQEDYEE